MWHQTVELAPRLLLWMIGGLATLSIIVAWQLRGTATSNVVRRLALIGICGILGAVVAGAWYWSVLPSEVIASVKQPANLAVLALAVVGLLATLAAWGHMANTGRLGTVWLWLAAGGMAVAIPAATVLREVRRYVALEAVGQWQPAVDAASEAGRMAGFFVFLLFLVINTVAIVWLISMVRGQLDRSASSE
jgi:hypothetical protein